MTKMIRYGDSSNDLFAAIRASSASATQRGVLALGYANAYLGCGRQTADRIYNGVNEALDSNDADLRTAAEAVADLAGEYVQKAYARG